MKRTSEIKIRKATTRDLKGIANILRAAYHRHYAAAGEFYAYAELVDPNYETSSGPYYSRREFVDANIRSIRARLRPPFRALVAVTADGKNVGKIVGYIILEKHKGRLWVNDTAVHPKHHGRGIATALFRAALGHHSKSKGKHEVWLWVNAKNPALRFWKRLGFKEVLREVLMTRKK